MTDGSVEADDLRYDSGTVLPGAVQNYSCIIANRTGGQGKTLVAEVLLHALTTSGVRVVPAAIDTAVETGGRSKLGRRYPEVQDYAISADIGEVATDGAKALLHWEEVVELFKQRNVAVDLGANVVHELLKFVQMSDISPIMRGRPVNFLVVTTAQDNAIGDAIATLAEIEKARGAMELGKIVVVLNEFHGQFGGADGNTAALRNLISAKGYATVTIGKCLFSQLDKGGSLKDLLEIDAEAFERRYGVKTMTAIREVGELSKWVAAAVDQFRAAGIVPPKA